MRNMLVRARKNIPECENDETYLVLVNLERVERINSASYGFCIHMADSSMVLCADSFDNVLDWIDKKYPDLGV